MLFDILTLGISALCRSVKNENNRQKGEAILRERAKKPIWEQAKETHMVSINGKEYYFITIHEIILNEEYWNSGLSMEDFLVKFYISKGKWFFPEPLRLFDKDGTVHHISGYDVLVMYYKKYDKEYYNKFHNNK